METFAEGETENAISIIITQAKVAGRKEDSVDVSEKGKERKREREREREGKSVRKVSLGKSHFHPI